METTDLSQRDQAMAEALSELIGEEKERTILIVLRCSGPINSYNNVQIVAVAENGIVTLLTKQTETEITKAKIHVSDIFLLSVASKRSTS